MTIPSDSVQVPQPPQPQYAPQSPVPSKKPMGLAIAALVVGIVAFLLGLLPVFGIILGLAGLVLGIMALVKKQPKGLALTGTILAGLAVIASAATTAGLGAAVDSVAKSTEKVAVETEEPVNEEVDEVDPEPEPVPEPEPEPEPEPVTPDLATFSETDDRSLALVAKDPDAFIGTNIILYGNVAQYDSFTGKCGMRLNVGNTMAEYSFDYKHNTIVYSGDGTADCPVLAPIVQDDNVKIWMTIEGSYSYDTTIGGTATAISGNVWHAEVLPPTEY